MYIGAQVYPWSRMYESMGKQINYDEAMEICLRSGYHGWEPSVSTAAEIDELVPHIRRNGLKLLSVYMNLQLHEAKKAKAAMKQAIDVAKRAADIGARYAVINPEPIDWNSSKDKDDEQLAVQADSLGKLGEKLKSLGIVLAYHTHDAEMRVGARELHHMLCNTDPDSVSWCFDADWIFQGCGQSALAVYDFAKLYVRRIRVVHLRQSAKGQYLQGLDKGAIDYRRLASILDEADVFPIFINEQIPGDLSKAYKNVEALYTAGRKNIENWFR